MKATYIRDLDGYYFDENLNVFNPSGKMVKFAKKKEYNKKRGGYAVARINGKTTYLHRLLAKTFIPNPENKPCVNHINGDGSDNRIENLEWATYKENNDHAKDNGLINAFTPLTVTDIETGIEYKFKSMQEAMKFTKHCRSCVCRILNGFTKSPKKYRYQYS